MVGLVDFDEPTADFARYLAFSARALAFKTSFEFLRTEFLRTPEDLLSEILYGMPYTIVGEVPLRFGCRCSHERMLISLATLPRADIEELIAASEPLEIACDYCGKEFAIAPEQLRGLIASS